MKSENLHECQELHWTFLFQFYLIAYEGERKKTCYDSISILNKTIDNSKEINTNCLVNCSIEKLKVITLARRRARVKRP